MLTAKNRDQLRNPTLGNRVWATFTFFTYGRGAALFVLRGAGRRGELMSVTAGYHFNMQTNLEIRQEQCCTVGIQLFKLRANKMIQNSVFGIFAKSVRVRQLLHGCSAPTPLNPPSSAVQIVLLDTNGGIQNQRPDLQNILRQSYNYLTLTIMPKSRSTYD